jgi:hypothetical protein
LVAKDNGKLVVFTELTKKLAPPQINSMPIMMASINPDRENETKGFRFMGQRFTVDASIFQRLIVRDVGPKGESCDKAPFNIDGARMLPMGLDIPAAMGSGEASKILKSKGEFDYACYPENMSKMQNYIANLSKDTWTQNLYWGWMYSLAPLISQKTEGYPSFMTNQAWTRKDLNTYLGSWTELKHDTILYAKQVYAEMGGGMPDEKDDRGYVEPNPYVYARLVSLLKMTNDGLSTRGLLDDSSKTNFDLMIQIATKLKNISEKELNGTALTADDYDFIKTYGGQLEHLWLEVNKNEPEFLEYHSSAQNFLNDNPSALVADVATDPNGQVLEEGTGYVSEIYVVVPIEGKLRIAKGGIYSYYEFPWPLSDRLTDRKWKDLLDQNKAPKLPDWTDSFTVPRYIPQ